MRSQGIPARFAIAAALSLAAIGAGAAASGAPAPYPWPDFDALFAALAESIGTPIRVYDLEMNRDAKTRVCVQDQDQPDQVDCYDWDGGALGPRIPVKFDEYPSVEAIDHHCIDLADIDFDRLPSLLEKARTAVKLPDARISRIALERGDSSGFLTYSDLPIWSFTLDTPRHDAQVEFDLRGKVLHADKD